MLVLSRKITEKVVLTVPPDFMLKLAEKGEFLSMFITVVDIDRGKIRLGFEAPLPVEILRGELTERPWKKV